MRTLLLLFVLNMLGISHAQDFHPKRFDRTQYALSAVGIALQGIDAGATMKGFAGSTPTHQWHEANPLIPSSAAGQGIYFAGTGIGAICLSNYAIKRGHRKTGLLILGIWIATESYASAHSLIGLQR